ncbi:DUF2188 domain-containing protein [Undibacterium sp. CY18W]|uniref:DUF2188 domain-containing protein n=1 Tax=Undibacterium hunanense TaxID=2762292 RepID=A0ABR6ZPQ5_9BURK|nr:DUF2188 domain-containing protein [Undibacterium hunanense]MBC3917475.1 DUF2188 domain-containing protein [Undibacterium hunanense]
MSIKKDQHVVRSSNGQWAVRSTGAEKASKVFASKDLAVSHARSVARSASTGVYIHGDDGRVLTKDSYASDTSKRGRGPMKGEGVNSPQRIKGKK